MLVFIEIEGVQSTPVMMIAICYLLSSPCDVVCWPSGRNLYYLNDTTVCLWLDKSQTKRGCVTMLKNILTTSKRAKLHISLSLCFVGLWGLLLGAMVILVVMVLVADWPCPPRSKSCTIQAIPAQSAITSTQLLQSWCIPIFSDSLNSFISSLSCEG